MIRTISLLATGACLLAVIVTPSAAQDTGVAGQVDSVLELSLRSAGKDGVRATASATIPGTRLTVATRGRERELAAYRGPVSNARVTVAAPARPSDTDSVQTITFGPQTP